jgi:hypothetical protein
VAVAKSSRIPRIGIAAVATSSSLGVVKGHVVSLVVGTRIAGMTKDAGFIGLACAADPNNVILLEWILAHTARCVAVDRNEM